MSRSPADADHLGVTLLFSLVAHAVIVLGVNFDFAEPAPRLPALEVILVQSANAQKPKQADFLAQANNAGGGEHDQARRPAEPVSGELPKPTPGLAPQPLQAGAPRAAAPSQAAILTGRRGEVSVRTERDTPEIPASPQPTARDLVERNVEMARLAEEVRRDAQAYAKRPKRKFISASTQEDEYAAYQRAWVARIERIGNLNYPDEARRDHLNGQLVLTVGLARDGRITRMEVIQPSGHKILDDAAQRIVQLAAPFPPLPKTGEDPDEVYITRTWQFLPGDILRNR